MPKMMIPPFEAFEKPEFHIGGDPDLVWETSATWTSFNDAVEETIAELHGLPIDEFRGTEGEYYSAQVKKIRPKLLSDISEVHGAVGALLDSYGQTLGEHLFEMWGTAKDGRIKHQAVVDAINAYNIAEQNAIKAKAYADSAVRTAIIVT
jgi:hypothetical protein